jgi:hypothetical protein
MPYPSMACGHRADHPQGWWPAAVFYPFGCPTQYAYAWSPSRRARPTDFRGIKRAHRIATGQPQHSRPKRGGNGVKLGWVSERHSPSIMYAPYHICPVSRARDGLPQGVLANSILAIKCISLIRFHPKIKGEFHDKGDTKWIVIRRSLWGHNDTRIWWFRYYQLVMLISI